MKVSKEGNRHATTQLLGACAKQEDGYPVSFLSSTSFDSSKQVHSLSIPLYEGYPSFSCPWLLFPLERSFTACAMVVMECSHSVLAVSCHQPKNRC